MVNTHIRSETTITFFAPPLASILKDTIYKTDNYFNYYSQRSCNDLAITGPPGIGKSIDCSVRMLTCYQSMDSFKERELYESILSGCDHFQNN